MKQKNQHSFRNKAGASITAKSRKDSITVSESDAIKFEANNLYSMQRVEPSLSTSSGFLGFSAAVTLTDTSSVPLIALPFALHRLAPG